MKLLKTKLSHVLLLIHQQSYFSQSTFNVESLDEHGQKTAIPWAPMFSHLYSCPVCFGYGMCNEVMKSSVLFHEKFKQLNTLLDIPVSQFALPVCSSEKLLVEIKKSFDENFDGRFSKEEKDFTFN
ncbi:tigger transposable element-derived protein 6 [Caerostris extrusa]|uniref:Tigger transposable element-derived protein 6 n=1 Tax=Caerostris extrusa TaxID=172846 RepID=A0AAV4SE57_CAEEX|nr:tigger transposable element-derived protein 6 [Caerostris extrusa]